MSSKISIQILLKGSIADLKLGLKVVFSLDKNDGISHFTELGSGGQESSRQKIALLSVESCDWCDLADSASPPCATGEVRQVNRELQVDQSEARKSVATNHKSTLSLIHI